MDGIVFSFVSRQLSMEVDLCANSFLTLLYFCVLLTVVWQFVFLVLWPKMSCFLIAVIYGIVFRMLVLVSS